MKKSAKTGRAIRPPRSPVLPIRVPQPVYDALKNEAKTAGMTLSEYVQQLITNGKKWQGAFGDADKLMQWANAEAWRVVDGALEKKLREHNWTPDEKGRWSAPERAPASVEPPAPSTLDPRITAEIQRAVQAALNERGTS